MEASIFDARSTPTKTHTTAAIRRKLGWKEGSTPLIPFPSLVWLLNKWGGGLEPSGLGEVNGHAISRMILHQMGGGGNERDVIASLTMTSEILHFGRSDAASSVDDRCQRKRKPDKKTRGRRSTVYPRVNEGITWRSRDTDDDNDVIEGTSARCFDRLIPFRRSDGNFGATA